MAIRDNQIKVEIVKGSASMAQSSAWKRLWAMLLMPREPDSGKDKETNDKEASDE